jgi:hypothetical protein
VILDLLVPIVMLSSVNSEDVFEEAKMKGAFRNVHTSAEDLAHVIVKAVAAIPGAFPFSLLGRLWGQADAVLY